MQVVDAIILLMLGLGAVAGFKRGFLRQTVESIGGILVVVFAFIFRGYVAAILYEILPAFHFKGIFAGISSLNILVYEVIAFIILLFVFGLIFRIILGITVFVEKLLNATFILAIPSKILGALMGVVEAYIFIFIFLFILTLPVFNINIINNSKYKDRILNDTPIISQLAKKTVVSFDDIYALKDELIKSTDRLNLDDKVLKILIDNNVVSKEQAEKLYEKGKITAK